LPLADSVLDLGVDLLFLRLLFHLKFVAPLNFSYSPIFKLCIDFFVAQSLLILLSLGSFLLLSIDFLDELGTVLFFFPVIWTLFIDWPFKVRQMLRADLLVVYDLIFKLLFLFHELFTELNLLID
jgi:hypothetical protein